MSYHKSERVEIDAIIRNHIWANEFMNVRYAENSLSNGAWDQLWDELRNLPTIRFNIARTLEDIERRKFAWNQ